MKNEAIPPILLQKGFNEIVQINRNTDGKNNCDVYKVNRPGIGHWIVKRIAKEFAVMYRTEKAILTSLRHDFLPIVFDVFEDDQALYIAMEYISGRNFKQLMSRGTKVSETNARKYFLQLCEIFEYLHNKGVVHKDCKPSNIMLSAQGNVHLIDFGVSKSGNYNPGGMSQAYAPPEQVADPNIDDPRLDIYSLGATMFSLLTGELPGTNNAAILRRIDISPKLRAIILKCMESKPGNRYQSIVDIKKALTKEDWAWKTAAAMVFILISATVTFFGYITWQNDITNNFIARGDILQEEGDYQRALSHFESYIRRRPSEPRGYERRRQLLLHQGKYTESLAMFADEAYFFSQFNMPEEAYGITWHNAVSHTILYYHYERHWDALLALLNSNPNILCSYQSYSMRAKIATNTGDINGAVSYYIRLLHFPWQYRGRMTLADHMQNLLNGASLTTGDMRYNFLAAAFSVATSHDSTHMGEMYEHITQFLIGFFAEEVWDYKNANNFAEALELLEQVFDRYYFSRYDFTLLQLRALVTLRLLIFEGASDFAMFAEYARYAIDAAGPQHEGDVAELYDLLNTMGV